MRSNSSAFLAIYTALSAQPPTAGTVIRARLLAQIEAAGLTVTSLAVKMGHVRHKWGRKLNPASTQSTSLTCGNVDEILAFLELDHRDVLEPVLFEDDRKALIAVLAAERFGPDGELTGGIDASDPLPALAEGGCWLSIWRLRAQDLVQVEWPSGAQHAMLALTPLALSLQWVKRAARKLTK